MLSLLLALVIVLFLSALPLYLAVVFLGGRATIVKVLLVNFLVFLVTLLIKLFFGSWAGLFSFLAMIIIYKELFDLGFITALLAWVLQFVFAVLLFLLFLVLGILLI